MAAPPPLQERVPLESTLQRLSDAVILALLLSLIAYRFASFHSHGGLIWFLAMMCEAWFTFVWALNMNMKWTPATYKTYPERLSKRVHCLPAVDMFVTTADPVLEPSIVTVNTVLSLLATEYPVDKLACYVSDDAGSPITFYSLVEASKFAMLWVPFCKKYYVQIRAPFVYFSREPEQSNLSSAEFIEEWTDIKNKYGELCQKIENASTNVAHHMNDREIAEFSNMEPGNHESIIKVIHSCNKQDAPEGFPHLIYVAREKRPHRHHHFKAGAMNVLTRVSGVMTNAPIMLNVDCDFFANNPEVILHGMCLLLGFEDEVLSGFVQAPQQFRGLKDDPFGNQLVVLIKNTLTGANGIQGPSYVGSGCFHRRKVLYGSEPRDRGSRKHASLSREELERRYGGSKELVLSAAEIISEVKKAVPVDPSSSIDAAKRVASCDYECNTCWGKEIGLAYGTLSEDVLTSLRIHSMGWRSAMLKPEPPAFVGGAPTGGPACLTQFKRWATGLLEALVSGNSPVLGTVTKKLEFRQCLAYLVVLVWPLRSTPELCYALLPAYSLIAGVSFLPKPSEPAFIIPLALFTLYNMYTLVDYLRCGLSLRAWWNNERMQRICALTSWLLGFFSAMLKTLGVSATVFEVTQKDAPDGGDGEEDPSRFTFDSSPVFVIGTAVTLVNLVAFFVGSLRLCGAAAGGHGGARAGAGELVCSGYLVLCFWPFVRGLMAKGRYGIPWAVIWRAALLVLIFLQLTVTAQGHIQI